MANITVSQPHIFQDSGIFEDWKQTSKTTNTVTYEFGSYKATLTGSFIDVSSGGLVGYVVGATLTNGTTEVWSATGLAIDASVLAGMKSVEGLYPFLFAGHDNVTGSNGSDSLMSGGGNDRISAGGGNDRIQMSPGSDIIDGGAGFDTVEFSGKLADYAIARSGTGYTVTHKGSGEVDTLANVERLYFADKAFATDIDPAGVGGQALRLYRAAFDRMPDDHGLQYWMTKMQTGTSLQEIARDFVASAEYKKLYAGASNAEVVNLYYTHILHRTPDADGAAFWTNVLDKHLATPEQVLVALSESKENYDASVKIIGEGLVLDLPIIIF